MSDYEATAYLSLEKLKVRKRKAADLPIGKTHARVLVVLRKDQERAQGQDEEFKRHDRAARQGIKASKNEKI